MAFDFTCTNCGKSLTQQKILFDLMDIVAGKEYNFRLLKLRLLERELNELFAAGKLFEEDERSNHKRVICTLSFDAWKKIMEGKHNLNLPGFSKITMDQLKKYAEGVESLVKEKSFSKEDYSEDEIRELVKEEKERVAAEKKVLRESDEFKLFFQLVEKSSKATAEVFTEQDVASDFAQLLRFLSEDGSIKMVLRKVTKPVEITREALLVGVDAYKESGSSIPMNNNMRRCPHCGKPLFMWAGTAKQRCIVFIGSQRTGKTSTILAVAHYLLNSGAPTEEGEIWKGVAKKPVSLVSRTDDEGRFEEELNGFTLGYAPRKTVPFEDVKKDETTAGRAYSVTLKLTNREGHVYYLSMMDIPGEVCNDTKDEVDTTAIDDHFNVVYTSEAYVLCLEHPVARYERRMDEATKELKLTGEVAKAYAKDNTPAMRVCGWASQIQALRSDRTGTNGYVPMLLLFTKDPNLENSTAAAADCGDNKNRYIFKDEQAVIQGEDKFNYLLETLGKMPDLTDAFRASLRCSPYGYKASMKGGENNQIPSPKNVHLVAQWLLYVTACIPVPLDAYGLKGKTYYIDPPDRRSMLPDEKAAGKRMTVFQATQYSASCRFKNTWENIAYIAMSRCILFENVREAERLYSLKKHDWVQLFNTVRTAHKDRDRREQVKKGNNSKGG